MINKWVPTEKQDGARGRVNEPNLRSEHRSLSVGELVVHQPGLIRPRLHLLLALLHRLQRPLHAPHALVHRCLRSGLRGHVWDHLCLVGGALIVGRSTLLRRLERRDRRGRCPAPHVQARRGPFSALCLVVERPPTPPPSKENSVGAKSIVARVSQRGAGFHFTRSLACMEQVGETNEGLVVGTYVIRCGHHQSYLTSTRRLVSNTVVDADRPSRQLAFDTACRLKLPSVYRASTGINMAHGAREARGRRARGNPCPWRGKPARGTAHKSNAATRRLIHCSPCKSRAHLGGVSNRKTGRGATRGAGSDAGARGATNTKGQEPTRVYCERAFVDGWQHPPTSAKP